MSNYLYEILPTELQELIWRMVHELKMKSPLRVIRENHILASLRGINTIYVGPQRPTIRRNESCLRIIEPLESYPYANMITFKHVCPAELCSKYTKPFEFLEDLKTHDKRELVRLCRVNCIKNYSQANKHAIAEQIVIHYLLTECRRNGVGLYDAIDKANYNPDQKIKALTRYIITEQPNRKIGEMI